MQTVTRPGFLSATKSFFGLKEGQSSLDFAKEIKALDQGERVEIYDMLKAKGIDCDPPVEKV